MTARHVSSERFRVIVVDTGGTFNKRYRPIDGALAVEEGSVAARAILDSAHENVEIDWLQPVCKDSLEMTDTDREKVVVALSQALKQTSGAPVVVIHGTDTIHLTGEVLATTFPESRIVLTGAMRPFEIDPVESALNLGLAMGFVQSSPAAGVYVAMSGLVRPLERLVKDRRAGVFRPA